MRRIDKKKNMAKANLLAEERHIQDKIGIEEYGYDELDIKYASMPADRKDKLVNWAKERQITNGILIKSIGKDSGNLEVSIMPKDIIYYGSQYIENFSNMVKRYNNSNMGQELTLQRYVSTNKNGAKFSLSARNGVIVNLNSKNIINVSINVYGQITPLNDKEWPSLKFDVQQVTLEYDGSGKFQPVDRKGSNLLVKAIKETLLEKFGKYSMPKLNDGTLFIPEINIHPNVFIS